MSKPKKIAVFYPHTHMAGWSVTLGVCDAYRRLGLDVIECGTPTAPRSNEIPRSVIDALKRKLPSRDALAECDAIHISGPEHIAPWIEVTYGVEEWRALSVPKIAVYHESANRADGGEFRFDLLGWITDHHFFPAFQDAEYFGQEQFFGERAHWEPFSVDTEMFKPAPVDRDIAVGFIGSPYGIRASFLEALSRFEHPPLTIGRCNYETIDGVDIRRSMELMVQDIRRMKVFFNLPALSQLVVGKVVEILACGVFCMTPNLPNKSGAAKNMTQFRNAEHLLFYQSGNLAQVADLLKRWSGPATDEERARIARAGMEHVHKNWSLDAQLARMLGKAGVCVI